MNMGTSIFGKMRSPFVLAVGGLAAGAAVLAQAVPHITQLAVEKMVNFAFRPPRSQDPQQWKWFPAEREPFEITVGDVTKLRGYFLPSRAANPKGIVVILHGHMSCADHLAWFAQQALNHEFHAVVYDARAHGKSEGDFCGFGLHEAADAKSIARHFAKNHHRPVSLWGISMGAAVGAQALAGDTPFSGGVLFSPFSNLDEMISATLQRRGIGWVPGITDSVRSKIRDVIGVEAKEISPEISAADIKVPVLVVHGSRDVQIPVSQGRAVFQAIPDAGKEFIEVPEAGHDDLVDFNTPWGKKNLGRVFAFLVAPSASSAR